MLGNAVLRFFARSPGFTVTGTVRSVGSLRLLPPDLHGHVRQGIDVESTDSLLEVFASVRPDVVINCVGVVKQLSSAEDPLTAIPINALLPHRLARLCAITSSRLIHVSTDCVFSGALGGYREDHPADAADLYGRSKHMGEVDQTHAVTLRTSIIGHELGSAHGLVGWFLAQSGSVKGFKRAIFSGLPTCELAKVMRDVVIPRKDLRGVYHVSAEPITKHDLLKLVAQAYAKDIAIVPDEKLVIDRSLDSTRLRAATGYLPPSWPELVAAMQRFS